MVQMRTHVSNAFQRSCDAQKYERKIQIDNQTKKGGKNNESEKKL